MFKKQLKIIPLDLLRVKSLSKLRHETAELQPQKNIISNVVNELDPENDKKPYNRSYFLTNNFQKRHIKTSKNSFTVNTQSDNIKPYESQDSNKKIYDQEKSKIDEFKHTGFLNHKLFSDSKLTVVKRQLNCLLSSPKDFKQDKTNPHFHKSYSTFFNPNRSQNRFDLFQTKPNSYKNNMSLNQPILLSKLNDANIQDQNVTHAKLEQNIN